MSDITLDEATLWQVEEQGHDITDSVAFHGPPGTGKTTTAAATVGRLLRDHDYDISDVAWVTYRRSLAQDTLERLADWDVIDERQLDDPTKGATRFIGTAHAVGNRCSDIAEEPAAPWQRAKFCEDRGMRFWTSEPWEDSPGKLLFRVLDYLANANQQPTDTEALHACPAYDDLKDEWSGNVVDAWYDWRDYKAQMQLIDFHEMLSRPLENNNGPNRDILVIDEYHDVTGLMDALFRQWMDDAEIVLVAGDPHQVVNAYDGASPEYFESLDLPTVLLPRSFRCTPEHWQVATSMLQRAHEPPNVSVDGDGLVTEYGSPTFEHSSENGWVTLPGPDDTASPGWLVNKYSGSTLLLARTQVQADGIGAALETAGIPYRSQRDLHGWNTEEGRKRLLLHNALQKLEGYTPGHLNYGGNTGFDRFSGGTREPRTTKLTNEEAALLLDAVNARVLDISRSDAEDQADNLRDSNGEVSLLDLDTWLTSEFWERYTAGAASVDRLNRSALGSGVKGKREIRAIRRALVEQDGPVDPDDIDTWAITIHASKGMEADDVAVYDGITNSILEGMRTSDKTQRNEYRTWYVACSRASKRLHIMRDAFGYMSSIIPDPVQEVV